MIPAMVLRNKTNPDRYLAASPDVGDWEDENLDVKMSDIQNAYMIVRYDFSTPTQEDFESDKKFHAEHKRRMIERYGKDAIVTLDFEAVCEHYEPVNIEITKEQYDYVFELNQ